MLGVGGRRDTKNAVLRRFSTLNTQKIRRITTLKEMMMMMIGTNRKKTFPRVFIVLVILCALTAKHTFAIDHPWKKM